MNRSQKKYFRALVRTRREANDPISESEIDSMADYVAARSRAAELQDMWERESERVTMYGLDGRTALPLARQIDATAKLFEGAWRRC